MIDYDVLCGDIENFAWVKIGTNDIFLPEPESAPIALAPEYVYVCAARDADSGDEQKVFVAAADISVSYSQSIDQKQVINNIWFVQGKRRLGEVEAGSQTASIPCGGREMVVSTFFVLLVKRASLAEPGSMGEKDE